MSEFINNTEKNRFEYHIGDDFVIANYNQKGDTIWINFVEAPEHLRGTGAAAKIMENSAQTARQNSLKIVPVCGYAALWFRRHPEYEGLLA